MPSAEMLVTLDGGRITFGIRRLKVAGQVDHDRDETADFRLHGLDLVTGEALGDEAVDWLS
jgi:hypothetical protein